MKKILITGSSGFIAKELIELLIKKDDLELYLLYKTKNSAVKKIKNCINLYCDLVKETILDAKKYIVSKNTENNTTESKTEEKIIEAEKKESKKKNNEFKEKKKSKIDLSKKKKTISKKIK